MIKTPAKGYITTKWKDIEYYDIPDNKTKKKITKEEFERLIGDTFEAMQINEHGEIEYIWTKKYVFEIKSIKLDMTSNILSGFLRNWQ